MKTLSRFVGTTILGGVLFLTPIVVLAFVLGKAFQYVSLALQPLAALIPDRLASAPTATAILAVALLAILCFLAGLCAQTDAAQRFVLGLERPVLSKLRGTSIRSRPGRACSASARPRSTQWCLHISAAPGRSGPDRSGR